MVSLAARPLKWPGTTFKRGSITTHELVRNPGVKRPMPEGKLAYYFTGYADATANESCALTVAVDTFGLHHVVSILFGALDADTSKQYADHMKWIWGRSRQAHHSASETVGICHGWIINEAFSAKHRDTIKEEISANPQQWTNDGLNAPTFETIIRQGIDDHAPPCSTRVMCSAINTRLKSGATRLYPDSDIKGTDRLIDDLARYPFKLSRATVGALGLACVYAEYIQPPDIYLKIAGTDPKDKGKKRKGTQWGI